MTYKHDNFFSKYVHTLICGLFVISCIVPGIVNGAVATRNTRAAVATRSSTSSTASATTKKTTATKSVTQKKVSTPVIEEPEPEIIIENKTSQFDDFMSEMDLSTSGDDNALAESIRAQRAAFTAQSNQTATNLASERARAGNKNECDQKLRTCMQSKCGNDFTKCSGDTDTIWGTKLDSCRRDTTCTGEEYKLFTLEIKADRDNNAEMALYNSIIDCGNRYNNCIITQCGPTFSKCLGKKSGDKAIEKCKTIAKECTEQDSGLANRAMTVFGNLRTDAEVQVANNEKRLYELRDLMRATCTKLGAMFDERTLDCVYSVEFYAGEDNTLQASKKAYAGSTFACTPNWFGIDVTTFMENAQRATRAQTAASSAMLGSGLGVGVGALTSGAIDRAVDRSKADHELWQALCENTNGTWNKALNTCTCRDENMKKDKDMQFDKEKGCIINEKKVARKTARTSK